MDSQIPPPIPPVPPTPSPISFKKYIPVFLLAGFIALCLGISTGVLIKSRNHTPVIHKDCTLEAKICPDGSAVGRIQPNCEFAACPIVTSTPSISPSPQTTYECPKTEYVDCMPGPDAHYRPLCETAFLQWAQKNCPGFKGAAL